MKKTLFLLIACALSFAIAQAQQAHCGFDEHLEKMLEKDPSGMQTILEHNARTEEVKHARLNGEVERGGGPRIIPTVFHVIHQGGAENISYEQIEDQIRSLNEDFRRMNADTVNTRAEFLPVAADANVEFRLAKLDPQNNCTNGVVRIFSPLTENASDDSGVKGLSYWDRTKYFNVWVVRTIDNDGEPGIVLGYAQFPGFGSASTDGVVMRADRVGSIGTAAQTGDKGRVLTHEAGHWLGLFHTFQGGCAGGFFGEPIDDTPPQADATPSNCPLSANTCSNDNPDLPDMVENYMDYSNGSCQNTYTEGQKDAMDAVLSGTRSGLHSAGNLDDTGVLLGETPCAPKAQFYTEQRVVCVGEQITLTDGSYNGEVTTYSWDLPGATPNSSSDASPTVTYSAAGVYNVTQTVSNAQGSDSETQTDYITVIPNTAEQTGWLSFEGFEETEEDYLILSDNLGDTWAETNAAFTGNRSIYLNNNSGNPAGSIDEFQLPSVDLTQMNDPDLYFRVAYKQRSSETSDRLRVYISEDCGESWSLRFNKQGGALSTVSGTQNAAFIPSSEADWEQQTVNLANYASATHFLVKFQGKSGGGNNIYIDDIQISGALSAGLDQERPDFQIFPNPAVEAVNVTTLNSVRGEKVSITLMDMAGKILIRTERMETKTSDPTTVTLNSIAPGIYLIRVDSGGAHATKKLIVE